MTLGGTYRGAFETGALAGSRFFVGGQYAFDNQLLGENQFLRRNTGTLFGLVQMNTGGDSLWNPTNVFSPIFRVQGKVFNNFTGFPLPPEENEHFRLLRQQSSIPIAMGEPSVMPPRTPPSRQGASRRQGSDRPVGRLLRRAGQDRRVAVPALREQTERRLHSEHVVAPPAHLRRLEREAASEIEATAGADELQITLEVRSLVLPSA